MEEALIKRVLPHSVEAEQSVIGAMLMDQEAIIKASEIISGDDFYQHQYGIVFDAIVELYNDGKPVDLITLQNLLREKDVPPEISSLEFVKDLLTSALTSTNADAYAQIVHEKAVLRKLIKVNEQIANDCYSEKEKLEDILEKAEKGLDVIMIDYLQLMTGSKRADSRQQEMSDISRSLKEIARELQVPVLALSQLSRAVEQRPDHRPMLSDLRESGAIEQDADVVMFLYRDDYYNKDSEKKNIAEVIIAKQRNGPIGTVELAWLPNLTKFANLKK